MPSSRAAMAPRTTGGREWSMVGRRNTEEGDPLFYGSGAADVFYA
jgi:hypothetical protein